MDEKAEILKGLERLFKKAENENLWFYSKYQKLWFSPQQLRKEHAEGRYIWAAVNWTLRYPLDRQLEK